MELNDTELPESSDDGLYEDIAKKKSKSFIVIRLLIK